MWQISLKEIFMKRDVNEQNPKLKSKFDHVDKLVEKEFKDVSGMGSCYKIWARKKQLLKADL